jgi:hypothetical protein
MHSPYFYATHICTQWVTWLKADPHDMKKIYILNVFVFQKKLAGIVTQPRVKVFFASSKGDSLKGRKLH